MSRRFDDLGPHGFHPLVPQLLVQLSGRPPQEAALRYEQGVNLRLHHRSRPRQARAWGSGDHDASLSAGTVRDSWRGRRSAPSVILAV